MSTGSSKLGDVITLRVRDTSSDELITRAGGRSPFAAIGSVRPESLVVTQPPAPPVVVRVGQKIGDYELSSVNKAAAAFTLPDGGHVELQVPRAGA
jgi:ABC-type hemin transport system substrate-binding protein